MAKLKSLYDRFNEEYTAAVVPANNKDGFKIKYVYYGPWYFWNLPEKELKRRKRIIALQWLGCVMFYIFAAVVGAEANSISYIAFPAMFSLCAKIFGSFGICQFFFAEYRTTRANYEDSNRRIRLFIRLNAILVLCAAAGLLVYIVCYGFALYRLVALLGYMADGCLSAAIWKRYAAIPFNTEKNDTLNQIERATMDPG